MGMEKVVHTFGSFEDADKADAAYYHRLTPQQRMDILLALTNPQTPNNHETQQRFERIYRIVDLAQS